MAVEDVLDRVLAVPRPGVRTRRWEAAKGLIRAARPHQWTKNLLVFAVPGAAGMLGNAGVLRAAGLAFGAFCLASSGTYLVNDVIDIEADRRHPTKRRRPLAAGEISVQLALATAAVAFVSAGLLAALASLPLLGVVSGYSLLSLAYTNYLKHLPIFDIGAVASGFFLRAVAGGAASHIYVSRWFLIVAGAGSLFLVTGKRYAELKAAGELAERTRPVLAEYTIEYLRALLSTTAGVTVIAYCLWAFQGSAHQHPSSWTAASAVPFVMGMMRYGLLLEKGHGEEPEQVILGDRSLLLIGAIWLVLIVAGVVG